MLGIHEAIYMIDKVKRNPDLHINALMIVNSVNKNYGRLYVRTSLDFVTNILFNPWDEYISYGLHKDSDVSGIQISIAMQKLADETLEEQKRDIETLKNKLISEFPQIEICVLLSPYYAFSYGECMITGEIGYSEVQPIINKDLQNKYNHTLKYLEYWNDMYKQSNTWWEKYKKENYTKSMKRIVREEISKFKK